MDKKTLPVLFLALLMFSVLIPIEGDVSSADWGERFLVDFGNGHAVWRDVSSGGTPAEILKYDSGYTVVLSGSEVISVDGISETTVGTSVCSWRLYTWSEGKWHAGGSGFPFAWGFYPSDTIVPSCTPDNPTSWTMCRGDSSSSGRSPSYGTEDAQTPMEWYRTYTTGYVDSSLIVADDLLYHTTGGTYGGAGSDKNPHVYCVNRFTGAEVWDFMMTYGQGYEVTSPVIVGDMLIVTATNWHVYCLDRYTGECLHDMELLLGGTPEDPTRDYTYVKFDAGHLGADMLWDKFVSVAEEDDISWDGRTFFTGGTTPVYDSGALYFGTADGHVLAYSITRAGGFVKLWDYEPSDTYTVHRLVDGDGDPVDRNGQKTTDPDRIAYHKEYTGQKGCFYFHAPEITKIGGQRALVIGSYEGYLYAVNADTGEEIWVERMIDLRGYTYYYEESPGNKIVIPDYHGYDLEKVTRVSDNIPHPGTPGSVSGYTVAGDKVLITCSDGGLSSQKGFVECMDLATCTVTDWKLDLMCGAITMDDTGNGFYAFMSPSLNGDTKISMTDGSEAALGSPIVHMRMDGKAIWKTQDYQLIKAPFTLADGILYTNDYSAGVFYPNGGGVTAISAEDGHEIWRLQLKPFTKDSYAMVAPTVIDGKIYVGNDYGAIYCISDIAGPEPGDGGEIKLGNGLLHWSWLILFAIVAVAFVILYKMY